MDYKEINQTLGREAVSRLEDAVLLALNVSQHGEVNGATALRELLVAMLGSVIWSAPTLDRAHTHRLVNQSIYTLARTLDHLHDGSKSKETIAPPNIDLTLPRQIASETQILVEQTALHLARMRRLNRQTSATISKSRETVRTSADVLSLCKAPI
jgi:hypothetical protein